MTDSESISESLIVIGGRPSAGEGGKTGGPGDAAPDRAARKTWNRERYEVSSRHGAGGQGVIMIAMDRHLNREVAMKILERDDPSGDPGAESTVGQAMDRFVEEAQITGQLEHPNIVPVYEIGEREGGRPFYTMKLIRGKSLSQILQGLKNGDAGQMDRFPLSRLLNIFERVCEALAFAHSRGVIHRDLKPHNIMAGDFGEVFLIDWGLAKIQGRHDDRGEELRSRILTVRDDSNEFTMDGSRLGTPAYMPPEQAEGLISEVDERSDVYSLGAILYEIVTLALPFGGGNPLAVMHRVIHDPLVPPGERAPERAVPADLCAIVEKAMAKKKEGRYQSVAELLDDIRKYMDGRPVSATEYTLLQLIRKWIARNRLLFLSASIVLLVLAGSVTVSYVRISRAMELERAALKEALVQKRNAEMKFVQSLVDRGNLLDEKGDLTGYVKALDEAGGLIEASGLPLFPRIAMMMWKARNCKGGWKPLMLELEGHSGIVCSVRFSPLENCMATCGTDGRLILSRPMEAPGGKPATLAIQGDGLLSLAYSPDGKSLAAGTMEGFIRVFDLSAKNSPRTLDGHSGPHDPGDAPFVSALAFDSSGKRVVSGSNDNTARVWDTSTFAELASLPHGRCVTSVAVSPDNALLATASADKCIRIWNFKDYSLQRSILEHEDDVNSLAFSPDGSLLASAGRDGTVRLLETSGWNGRGILGRHGDEIKALAFSPNGEILASAGMDGRVKLWNPGKGKYISCLSEDQVDFHALDFSRDGCILAAAGSGGRVFAWDFRDRGGILQRRFDPGRPGAMAFEPGKNLLALAVDRGIESEIRILDCSDLREIGVLRGNPGSVLALTFSPDGRFIASAGSDEALRIWSVEKLGLVKTLGGRDPFTVLLSKFTKDKAAVFSLAYSPDGRFLAAGSQDKVLRLWDAEKDSLIAIRENCHDEVRGLAFSQDGKFLAAAYKSRAVEILLTEGLEGIRSVEAHEGHVSSMILSRDGRILYTGGSDNLIKAWDPESLRPILTMRGHRGDVLALALDRNGTVLLSGDGEGSVMAWDTSTGECFLTLQEHEGKILDLKFGHDDSCFASTGEDGTLRLFRIGVGLREPGDSGQTEKNTLETKGDGE